jgi:hypothetical protein
MSGIYEVRSTKDEFLAMKNEQLQVMGVTPWMGDTRPKNKGGRKAEKSLTAAVKAAEAVRDECRGLKADCKVALDAVGFVRRRMQRDLVRLAWFAGGLSALNVALVLLAVFH